MAAIRTQYKEMAQELEIKTHKLTLLQEQHQQSEVQQVKYNPPTQEGRRATCSLWSPMYAVYCTAQGNRLVQEWWY